MKKASVLCCLIFQFCTSYSQPSCNCTTGYDWIIGRGTKYEKASDLPSTTISNATVAVVDNFLVDRDLTFKDCHITVCPAKHILVWNNAVTLALRKTDLSGCPSDSIKWNEIHLVGQNLLLSPPLGGAVLIMEKSSISDAEIGVFMEGGSMLNCLDSDFISNDIGVYSILQ